ncbi:hypothetical protein CO704_25125 (plasmid) [Cedecea neteri]|uniref:Uncharacterized protein n=1 Tax=Cedecea neteri TaxID=158822 RepID=A0A291E644_9ENTR|nr:hypothetical protein CO704_25125 [Cedecea neteri]
MLGSVALTSAGYPKAGRVVFYATRVFHQGPNRESRRLNIPRTVYYWYGGFVAKRMATMLGYFICLLKGVWLNWRK